MDALKKDEIYTIEDIYALPDGISLARVKKRSFQKFGDRILPDGDLYEKEKNFWTWRKTVRNRTLKIISTIIINPRTQLHPPSYTS